MTAQERKEKTELFLKKNAIPFNPYLPLVDEAEDAKIRSASDIARRILILSYLCAILDNNEDKEDIIEFLKSENLWVHVSEKEKKLFQKEKLTEQETINISWRSEAIYTMFWAINKIEKLSLPTEETSGIFDLLPEFLETHKTFIEESKIRDACEILDETDLIYRLHWATRQADIDGSEMPANLDSSIVQERHYALNWITYYEDDWDDITTDT